MDGASALLSDPAALIVAAIFCAALSGLPGLLPLMRGGRGQRVGLIVLLAGSICGLTGAVQALLGGNTVSLPVDWTLPFDGCEIAIDPLSAIFLIPAFLISFCSALYAISYRPAPAHRSTEPRLTFFTGMITAAIAGILVARNFALFLVAWEIMALSCYFLMSVDDEKAAVREAATLYLITTHIGTLALFAAFSLLNAAAGSFIFPGAGSLDGSRPIAVAIFLTALFGFGMKAGIMPLHIWLPSAHANAPSNISALMSGVLIKIGIYGIIRTTSFFAHVPLWWGGVILFAGIISGIAGVAFALGQHDLKRLLAYHSIENIGIIAMGVGAALIGRSLGNPSLVLLGMAGALLHVINHATFKSLLFFAAGAVIHSTGTREIDQMGGLARQTPWTAFHFLVGSVAICGLPPLNGFVSEMLIYSGLFRGIMGTGGGAAPFLALGIPALALIGGLASACFVKVYGAAFLGTSRSEKVREAEEASLPMLIPMATLSAICFAIGLFPLLMAPLLQTAVRSWDPALPMTFPLSSLAPLGWLTLLGFTLLSAILLLGWNFRRSLHKNGFSRSVTWDCGYALPNRRMQYTASSFAAGLVELFSPLLRPHGGLSGLKGLFPGRSEFGCHVPEVVLESVYMPFLKKGNQKLSLIRRLQHGQLHLYILYILITLILLLISAR